LLHRLGAYRTKCIPISGRYQRAASARRPPREIFRKRMKSPETSSSSACVRRNSLSSDCNGRPESARGQLSPGPSDLVHIACFTPKIGLTEFVSNTIELETPGWIGRRVRVQWDARQVCLHLPRRFGVAHPLRRALHVATRHSFQVLLPIRRRSQFFIGRAAVVGLVQAPTLRLRTWIVANRRAGLSIYLRLPARHFVGQRSGGLGVHPKLTIHDHLK
jgi:hypothetical protein